MPVQSLTYQAFQVALGFFYPSDRALIPLENKGSIIETLPPVLGKISNFVETWTNNFNQFDPYIAKPIRASFLSQTIKAVHLLARVISLLASCLFASPIGIFYNGVKALLHYRTQKDSENIKVHQYALGCFEDFCVFSSQVFLPFISYQIALKAWSLKKEPNKKLLNILLSVIGANFVREYIFQLANLFKIANNPLEMFQLCPDIALGLVLKKRFGFVTALLHKCLVGINSPYLHSS